ncbi:hypothetical protein [uncultured Sunxiuqinia sp.]|uniref:hypothetical protein n=1 Tax=uncultured Sunxiuqinia sp. TaxID=1573825 RepID=UPI002AA63A04|nr:hypothetical protein [uncultured Sunxiuqinia sp.]
MLVLVGILVGLFLLLAVGTWLSNHFGKQTSEPDEKANIALDCCGAHEICDFEEMLNNPDEIVYFEDEELDRYKGVNPNEYQDDQIDEFREVLYTLDGEEVRKWLLSIERRKIQLPSVLKQEAIQLLAEA